MSEAIICSIISGVITLAGVIITVVSGNKKTENQLKVQQAVTDEKIEELTREVREHNNFARRMPVVENEIQHIEEKICELHKND